MGHAQTEREGGDVAAGDRTREHIPRGARTVMASQRSADMQVSDKRRLVEIALLFLRLGTTAFGGPAAHVSIMEDEIVRRRKWLSREEFLDYLGAANLIPGPNSTELAIHIGHARGGWPGLIIAGSAFIIPAMVMVGTIAWIYTRYGALPEVSGVLYGVKPIVIAVILQALWNLGRTAVKTRGLAVLGGLAVVAVGAGVHELVVLAAGGLGMALARTAAGRRTKVAGPLALGAAAAAGGAKLAATTAAGAAVTALPFGLWPLFLVFAKIGSVLYGSGYVLLAFLRADFVQRFGWLTEQQLLDATAVGQVTPGPVFTTATFIGYVLGGPAGALVATFGIFVPAFVFVALSGPLVPRLRQSPTAAAVLDGVNVASLALMAVVSFQLARAALVDIPTVVLAVLSLAALLGFRVNSAWLVAAGGLAGWLVALVHGR
jgi:chromate transporter